MIGQTDNNAGTLAPTIRRSDRDVPPIDPLPAYTAHVVLLATLRPAQSPRLVGEDPERIRLLAETEGPLPPIIVHRTTMRVVDGMHRLAAARLRGQETIDVVFFDGTDDDAFVMAVRANVIHGLPLSYADREAAVGRIVESHPAWSDRAIAATTGLSARTVASIRGQLLGPARVTARIGRDGRVRPLDSAEGRRTAGSLLEADPNQSLRKIARTAGISPATVRDVRDRLRRGEDPVPSPQSRHQGKSTKKSSRMDEPQRDVADPLSNRERNAVLQNLERDPSLRFAESGRGVLRWLYQRVIAEEEWQDVAAAMPPHSGYIMAGLARRCANEWLEFAKHLEGNLHPRN